MDVKYELDALTALGQPEECWDVTETLASVWRRFSVDGVLYCDVFVVGHKGSLKQLSVFAHPWYFTSMAK